MAHIDWVTVSYIKDAFIVLMVIGATIYNIMQDKRIQHLENENDILKDRLGAVIDETNMVLDDFTSDHTVLIDDCMELYGRVRKCEKKIKEVCK